MPLASAESVLKKAQKEGYAVGAFNAENMEMVQAITAAAEELDAPVIIQTTPSTLKYAQPEMFAAMAAAEAQRASVPVVLHLDHGDSFELCEAAIAAGYTSVMIDGSKMSFEDNIAISRKTATAAAKVGIPVEAELGTVGGKEDGHVVNAKDALYTNPNQAREFTVRTGVQFLAVAIGTAHGFYSGKPQLDFSRLDEIRKAVSLPLVLHGASGVADEDVQRAIGLGICKVNFATELRVAFTRGVQSIFSADSSIYDPKKYNGAGREEVKQVVKHKIKVCKRS